MKISEVMRKLEEIRRECGDLEVQGVGHPVEFGFILQEDNFLIGTGDNEELILFLTF